MSGDKDRTFAAVMMLCEAESEGQEAMLWCLWAAYNRTKDHRYPKTLSAVIAQRMQFSEFNDDRVDNANLLRVLSLDDSGPEFEAAYTIYDEWLVLAASSPDPTLGSTHFYAEPLAPPMWSKPPAIFRGQVNRVRFYSNVA